MVYLGWPWNTFCLGGCNSLEKDTSCFGHRRSTLNVLTCELCGLEPEDPAHFIIRCPALMQKLEIPCSRTFYLTILLLSVPDKFLNVLSIEWIHNKPLLLYVIEFLNWLCLVHIIVHVWLQYSATFGPLTWVTLLKKKNWTTCACTIMRKWRSTIQKY